MMTTRNANYKQSNKQLSIDELVEFAESMLQNRTKEDAFRFLLASNIIDETGYLDERYFSKEDVEESRKGHPITV